MSEILGPGEKPRNVIEEIGGQSLDAIKRAIEEKGGTMEKVVLALWVRDIGLPDSVVCGEGIENPADLFSFLISEAISTGKQLGLTVKVMNVKRPGQG